MNPSPDEILWPQAPTAPRLADGEVHLWAMALDNPVAELSVLAETLSEAERERAAAFRFDVHRNRFIAGRGLLRRILGGYLAVSPGAIEFTVSPRGKPAVAERHAPDIHFNLAHSDALGLCAVTRVGPLGTDVERIREVRDVDELVARFFHSRETGRFHQLKDADKPEAFFNLWTRKEALLKATGVGITGGLNGVEVTFLANEPARVLTVPSEWPAADTWTLRSLLPARGYVGAVAASAGTFQVRTWRLGGEDFTRG